MSGSPILPLALQEAMLRDAANQQELRQLIPAVVSLSFGVLPITQRDGILILACRPDIAPTCFNALRALVKMPIHGLSFDRELMGKYLRQLNRQVGGVNLPTFESSSFLQDPSTYHRLLTQKTEKDIDPSCTVSPDELVLLEYRYTSWLNNIDNPVPVMTYNGGAMEIAFRVREGTITVYRSDALDPATVLLCRRQFAFYGVERGWGIAAQTVKRNALPYVIHPSEIQLKGVSPTELTIHVYDHDEIVPIGKGTRLGCNYFFLDSGQRQHRKLEVEVLGSWLVRKSELVVKDVEEFGDQRDLDLWFQN